MRLVLGSIVALFGAVVAVTSWLEIVDLVTWVGDNATGKGSPSVLPYLLVVLMGIVIFILGLVLGAVSMERNGRQDRVRPAAASTHNTR